MKFDLKCPMTMSLMKTPARGKNCRHLGCFDLETYISMQRKSKVNQWKCTLCPSYVYELIYDLFIKEIIDKVRDDQSRNIVEMNPNAEYRIIQNEEAKNNSIGLPLKRQPDSECDTAKVSKNYENIIIVIDSD